MGKGFLIAVIVVAFLLIGYPSAAMMEGGHGHSQDYDSRGDDNTSRRPVPRDREAPAGHRHADYTHSHEGGELPHTHGETSSIRKASPSEAPPPRESEHPRQQVAPRPKSDSTGRKARSKATPASTDLKAKQPAVESATGTPSLEKQPEVLQAVPSSSLKASFQAKDEVPMHLIRGGRLNFPMGANAKDEDFAEVDSFYMDETQVTNHQYVEFLNKTLSRIKVENGVVRGDGDIWLLLGEVREGYEPIVFEDGGFRVKGVHHAACVVLRVTAHGASAYAQFFGKRLPTETEWLYAVGTGAEKTSEARDSAAVVSNHSTAGEEQSRHQDQNRSGSEALELPPIPSPVILYPANAVGVRGLNANLGEWGLRAPAGASHRGSRSQPEYVVLSGTSNQSAPEGGFHPAIRRYPWEAFAEVGFRCVQNVPGEGQ